jgi:hypothetical protein
MPARAAEVAPVAATPVALMATRRAPEAVRPPEPREVEEAILVARKEPQELMPVPRVIYPADRFLFCRSPSRHPDAPSSGVTGTANLRLNPVGKGPRTEYRLALGRVRS